MPESREPEGRGRRLLEGVFLTGLSVLALAVSAYSTYWQRQQARAMVLPRLQLSTTFGEGRVTMMLENVGVGPADIKTVQLLLDGKPLASWRDFFRALDGHGLSVNYSNIHGRVIGAGKDVRVMEVSDPQALERIRAALPRLTFELCYCSVLEECWHLVDGEQSLHDAIGSCKAMPNTFHD
jgi:hypothetical protein